MICQQVQSDLSLYLYGELNFAREEAIEEHIAGCAFCERALAREKAWHISLKGEYRDFPLDLLSECRRELKKEIAQVKAGVHREPFWRKLLQSFEAPTFVWSRRLAVASFLVLMGFGAGRWIDRNGVPGFLQASGQSEMSLFGPNVRVRDVRPDGNGQVRILLDQVRQGEVVARLDDNRVRRLVFAASQDLDDPGMRVDSVEVLIGQAGDDVRDALIFSASHDPNAGVRLKALEGLRQFASEPVTREALKSVLEHDDNTGVRSEAINILLPAASPVQINPDLVNTLEGIVRSEQGDEYVRMRCLQILRDMRAPLNIY